LSTGAGRDKRFQESGSEKFAIEDIARFTLLNGGQANWVPLLVGAIGWTAEVRHKGINGRIAPSFRT
jgi:hypothetical protein